MTRTAVVLLIALLSAGCRRNPEDAAVSEPAPPPAAMLAGAQDQSLDQQLRLLEKEVSDALAEGVDKAGQQHMFRAEALTDGLLESKLPFMWLTSTSYSLEGYVRQIQALADRIVAEIRSGTDRGTITQDAIALRRSAAQLRRALAMGGGNPPVPLDSLLAGIPADTTLPTDAGE